MWGLLLGSSGNGLGVKLFFLGCVLIAGIYSGLTAARKILLIQALPALLALLLLRFA